MKFLVIMLLLSYVVPMNAMEDCPVPRMLALENTQERRNVFGYPMKPMDDATRGLWQAVHEKNIEESKALILQGADVNAQDTADETMLMEVACKGNSVLSKLLLEHGADVGVTECNGETVFRQIASGNPGAPDEDDSDYEEGVQLKYALLRNEIFETLVVYSMFVPYCLPDKIADAREQIFAVLCTLRTVCRELPRDIRYKILASDPDMAQHLLLCPFALHALKYDRVLAMPYAVTASLIKNNLLNGEQTVQIIKKHKMEMLTKLLDEAFKGMDDFTSDDEIVMEQVFGKVIFYPTRQNWKEHYTPKIEEGIRRKLGLIPQE